MNTSVLSSMIAKRKMKTVTEAAAKNPENPNESSVQYVLPPDVPQCYRAAWDLGREQFSALLKETNLSREVTRLLYGLRDPEKFDVNFQKAKELLIPSHPKIFIAVAKYLKPKYKKVMVDYMCSTKLTF
ncbi:unnamed protein product [Auanema sp. JU1783]|nr:unnamed protein product [Auanema sp. JU1783]